MRDILAPEQRSLIEQLGWARSLLLFDYDGTLAPIVDDRAAAEMRPETQWLLAEVASRYPCAVVSGRARDDARLWLEGVPLRSVVGNHGLEPWENATSFERAVARWLPRLEEHLAREPGVVIENKRFSVAIHYRAAPAPREAEAAVRRAVSSIDGVRVIGGKMVLNLVPEGAPHKGTAVLRLRQQHGCDTAVYVGDDETDEDVFRAAEPGRLLGVRVGENIESRASYFLESQDRIDDLLRAFLAARPSPSDVREEHHAFGF